MCAPNLLQFVPNDYIANNYLVAVELGHHIFDPCSKFIANLIGLTLEFSQN